LLGIDDTEIIFLDPSIVWNYQKLRKGSFFHQSRKYFQAETFLITPPTPGPICVARLLYLLEVPDKKTNLPRYVSGERLLVPLEEEAWVAYFVQKEDYFIMNYENK